MSYTQRLTTSQGPGQAYIHSAQDPGTLPSTANIGGGVWERTSALLIANVQGNAWRTEHQMIPWHATISGIIPINFLRVRRGSVSVKSGTIQMVRDQSGSLKKPLSPLLWSICAIKTTWITHHHRTAHYWLYLKKTQICARTHTHRHKQKRTHALRQTGPAVRRFWKAVLFSHLPTYNTPPPHPAPAACLLFWKLHKRPLFNCVPQCKNRGHYIA